MRNQVVALLWLGFACVCANAENCETYDFVPDGFGEWGQRNWAGSCSGHGKCVENKCVCESGWTGRSDLLNTEGIDCQVNETVIKYLWIVNVVISLAQFLYGLPKTITMYMEHRRIKRRKKMVGEKFGLRDDKGLMASIIYSIICFPAFVSAGFLKIARPNERLGFTWGFTILFALCKFGLYTSMSYYHPALLDSILKGEPRVRHVYIYASRFNGVLTSIAAFMGLVPFLCFLSDQPVGTINLVVWYTVMASTAFQLLLLLVLVFWIYREVFRVLDGVYRATHSEALVEMKASLQEIRKESLMQCVVQGILYTAYTVVPFLYNKHDYLLPIAWSGYAVIGRKIAIFTVRKTPTTVAKVQGLTSIQSSGVAPQTFATNATNVSNVAVPTLNSRCSLGSLDEDSA